MAQMGYYPGCSLSGMALEYSISVERVFKEIGVGLKEIPDWNCCGASSAHMLSDKLPVGLGSRNLSLAGEAGLKEIVVPCALCSESLLATMKAVEDPGLKAEMEDVVGRAVPTDIKVYNVIEALEAAREQWENRIGEGLKGLKAAAYYGCYLLRPKKITGFDNCENPTSMEKLIADFGAEPVEWAYKNECCGGGFTMSNSGEVAQLVARIYEDARANGAEALVVACPMCFANLEMRAPDASKILGEDIELPILYLTDLLGLALGLSAKELGLEKHMRKAAHLAAK